MYRKENPRPISQYYNTAMNKLIEAQEFFNQARNDLNAGQHDLAEGMRDKTESLIGEGRALIMEEEPNWAKAYVKTPVHMPDMSVYEDAS